MCTTQSDFDPRSVWPSTHSPAPHIVADWSHRLIGTLLHSAVQRLVLRPLEGPMHDVARQASEDIVPARLPLIQRQMVAQRVAQGVAVWLEEFDPRPAWRPLGVEVNVDDVRIDLLWAHPTRGIRADELKSGKLTARDHKQARSIDAAGMAAFGVSWQGVRLISLSPISSKSAIIRRGGAR